MNPQRAARELRNHKVAAIHYDPHGPAEPLIGNQRGVIHEPPVTEIGVYICSDPALVTCGHCRRLLADPMPKVRLTLGAPPWAPELPHDGITRWAEVGGRYWRVRPRAGRDNGYEVEEVTELGEPAGTCRCTRLPSGGFDMAWEGGFWGLAATLGHARERIAEQVGSRIAA